MALGLIPLGIGLAVASAAVSASLTVAARRILPALGMVSPTDPHHPEPVPLGGGIVVWLVSAAGLGALGLLQGGAGGVLPAFLGGTALFAAGVWDDVRLLDPRAKLFLQLVVAALVVGAGTSFPLGPELVWLSIPLTLLWFVGVCNAFNLIDNMDGMLPGVAAIAAVFVGVFGLFTGREDSAVLAWIVAGACLGFLPFNLPPARIFLGDSGSMFLGFLLAGLAIGDSWRGLAQVGLTVLAPALLLAVPIFNTTFVTVARKLAGVPLARGKADHINYRLLAHGFSRGGVLAAVYALAAVAGLLGVLVVTAAPLFFAAGALLFLVLLLYLGVFLYQGRVAGFYQDFQVEAGDSGWEDSPWYRWVIRFVAMAGDVMLVLASLYAAFALRYGGQVSGDQLANLSRMLPWLIVVRVGLALATGVYETRWSLGVARDALRLLGTVLLGSLVFAALLYLLRPPSFPRTVVVIEGMLSLLFFGATRLGVRALGEFAALDRDARRGRRTVIAGSADGFLAVHRVLRDQGGRGYHVIGFVDEDPAAHRGLVSGVRVLGPVARLPALARLAGAEHVLFAFPPGEEGAVEGYLAAVLEAGLTAEVVQVELLEGKGWLEARRSAGEPPTPSSQAG